MSVFKKSISYLFILLIGCLASTGAVSAFMMGSSDMILFSLQFSSTSDPLAELFWTDVWYGTTIAHAQDTDSGSQDGFNDMYGDNGDITVVAETAHVESGAGYIVVDGEWVAIAPYPDASVAAITHSDVELYVVGQGDGYAIAGFDNYFKIYGGAPGGPVDVTFNLDYSGQLEGKADENGYYAIALAGLFGIEDLDGNELDMDLFYEVYSGIDSSFPTTPYNGTLSVSARLLYSHPTDQDLQFKYLLFAEADSEVYGYNIPEPETLFLLLVGVPLAIWVGRKRNGMSLR